MGSYMEPVAERDPQAEVRPLRKLDVCLTRPPDRGLFDLPTIEMS
ncbi:MAG: hypothetical protein OXN89_15710 [Bryobacterales bacterium]|nr:hypothetical protein [Bryobacterales bacterium]